MRRFAARRGWDIRIVRQLLSLMCIIIGFVLVLKGCNISNPAYGQAAQPVAPVVNNVVVSPSNPFPTTSFVDGIIVSPTNPLPNYVFLNGAAVSANNPFPVSANLHSRMYAAATVGFSRATAGDILCITGSNSKTVKVKRLTISASSTNTAIIDIAVILRSTPDSGDTPVTLTSVPFNSSNSAGTAIATVYSTTPTPGTAIGTISTQKYTVVSTTSPQLQPTALHFEYDNFYDQQLTLTGANQVACLSVGAVIGGSWNISVRWSEE